jgi:hypothetical protein
MVKMDHMNAEQIRSYAAGELPYDECLEWETHLATCEDCARRVGTLFSVKENFDRLWKTWTIKAHAKEFHLQHLRRALIQADAAPDIRQRLATWAENIGNLVEIALGVSLDISERTVRIVQEGLEFLQGVEAQEFIPAPVPLTIAGAGDRPEWVAVESLNPPWTKVTIDPTVQRILVQSNSDTIPPPLAALVSRDHDWAAATPFRAVEGEEFVLAEFKDIPSGEFVLLVERMHPTDPERQ